MIYSYKILWSTCLYGNDENDKNLPYTTIIILRRKCGRYNTKIQLKVYCLYKYKKQINI